MSTENKPPSILLDFLSDILAGLIIYSTYWFVLCMLFLLVGKPTPKYGSGGLLFFYLWGVFCVLNNLRNRAKFLVDSNKEKK